MRNLAYIILLEKSFFGRYSVFFKSLIDTYRWHYDIIYLRAFQANIYPIFWKCIFILNNADIASTTLHKIFLRIIENVCSEVMKTYILYIFILTSQARKSIDIRIYYYDHETVIQPCHNNSLNSAHTLSPLITWSWSGYYISHVENYTE